MDLPTTTPDPDATSPRNPRQSMKTHASLQTLPDFRSIVDGTLENNEPPRRYNPANDQRLPLPPPIQEQPPKTSSLQQLLVQDWKGPRPPSRSPR
ncbi:hypothetical protein PZA11_006194 [Diplocarpon coronariae]